MVQVLPLLAGAALVGILHMSAPDHWVTLCILGKRAAWSRTKLMGFGLAAAGGHVLLSVVLGFAIVAAGLVFSHQVTVDVAFATGLLMLILGSAYGLKELLTRNVEDYGLEAEREMSKAKSMGRGLPYFVVLGGALSPDLSILPVFILAVPTGLALAAEAAIVFALASILTLIALVLVGSAGIASTLARAPAKYNDALVGFVIAAVGAYVILSG